MSLASIGNKIVLGGLIVSGSLMAGGLAVGNGGFLAFGAYMGWFFGFYSAIVYFVSSVRFALKQQHHLWLSLSPVNFGLTVIGISVLGLNTNTEVLIAAITSAIAIAVSIFFVHCCKFQWRVFPITIFSLLSVPILEQLTPLWQHLYLFVGIFLVSVVCVKALKPVGAD